MALLNLNRFELDNLRRSAQGTPRPVIYGASEPGETSPEYTFYLRNNSNVAIPAESVIAPLLVWDLDPWTVRLDDGAFTSSAGMFGTTFDDDWDRNNSQYDALLASVIIDHVCYLRLQDLFARNLTSSSDIAGWEVVTGDADGCATSTAGRSYHRWSLERRRPATSPGRFYAVNEIPAGAQGEIKFINDVRPCFYSPDTGVKRFPTRPVLDGSINFNLSYQHSLTSDSYFNHRSAPRYIDEFGNVLSYLIYNPTKSPIASQSTSMVRNASAGLATKQLVATMPPPTVTNYNTETGAVEWTAELDYWEGETYIDNSNGRARYWDPWTYNDYNLSGASVSNKLNAVNLLGLAVDSQKWFGTWGGFRWNVGSSSIPQFDLLGFNQYAIFYPMFGASTPPPHVTASYSDPFNPGQSLQLFELTIARNIYQSGGSWADLDGVNEFTPLFRPATNFVYHPNEGCRGVRMWLEPVFPSTRLFYSTTAYSQGTFLTKELDGVAQTSTDERYAIAWSWDCGNVAPGYYCYIIKAKEDCYIL